MIRNAGTHDESLRWYRAVFVVTALAITQTTLPVIAQEASSRSQFQDPEREEYAGRQRHAVQTVRDINLNLLEAVPELTLTEEDQFRRILRDGTQRGTPGFRILQDGLRWEIYRASDPVYKSSPARFQGLKTRLQNNILDNAGRSIGGRRQKLAFRELVCSEALSLLKDLLNNNLQARSLAIELLPSLETITDTGQRRILDEAADVLIDVLNDVQQPDAVKLRAAESITLYLQNVEPGAQIEIKFAMAIGSELESWLPATGYQVHLIDAISRVRTAREVIGATRRPVVIETLVDVIQDKRREPLVRCGAAGALGLVGVDQRINGDPLAWKVTQLSAEMAAAYNQNSGYQYWSTCSLELFFAFKHRDIESQSTQLPNGMLNKWDQSTLVRSAYAQVLPIVAAVLDRQDQVDAATIENVNQWVADNQPNNMRFDPDSLPVNP